MPAGSDPLADVDFPGTRDSCLEAVEAARKYVQATGGASASDLTAALKPEDNYVIGLAGVQMVHKLGDTETYRDWWWDTVAEPGLRAIPDIAPPGDASQLWRPADDAGEASTSQQTPSDHDGFDSPTAVQETLADGVLFELAYWTDAEVRRIIVASEGRIRPSALPVDSPPGFRFHAIATDETYDILLPELIDLSPVALDALQDPLQTQALTAMADAMGPDAPPVPLTDAETALEAAQTGSVAPRVGLELAAATLRVDVTRFDAVATDAFELLQTEQCSAGDRFISETRRVAANDPGTLLPYADDLANLLDDDQYGTGAAICLATVADTDATAVLNAVPALAAAADSAHQERHQWILYAFSTIAGEHPEALLPTLNVLIDAVRTGDETTRQNALSAIGQITGSYPDAAEQVASDVAELLAADDPVIRGNAVGLLGDLAQEHPALVMKHGHAIAPLLTDPDPNVRHNASITLLRAGEANPAVIRDHPEELEAALDDDNPEVRANACSLIGNTGATVSVEELRSLADNDPDETVRERADWAAERIT